MKRAISRASMLTAASGILLATLGVGFTSARSASGNQPDRPYVLRVPQIAREIDTPTPRPTATPTAIPTPTSTPVSGSCTAADVFYMASLLPKMQRFVTAMQDASAALSAWSQNPSATNKLVAQIAIWAAEGSANGVRDLRPPADPKWVGYYQTLYNAMTAYYASFSLMDSGINNFSLADLAGATYGLGIANGLMAALPAVPVQCAS